MSEIIVDNLQPNSGQTLNFLSNVNIVGYLSAQTIYGNSNNLTQQLFDIIPVGTDFSNVGAYLNYGINIISTSSASDYCVQLPEIPIEGKQVTVINKSDSDIVIYPSVSGGTINGVLNGSSIIPPDNKAYNFICYENPNPGAWSGNFTAGISALYDSGIISIDTTLGDGSGMISAYNNTFKNNAYSFASTNVGFDGLTLPNVIYNSNPLACGNYSAYCAMVWFKPQSVWNSINKVTVYTNFTTGATVPGAFSLMIGEEKNYYSAGTTFFLQNGGGRIGNAGQPSYGYTGQRLPGIANITSSGYTANPGEPGTYWGQLIYSASTRPTLIGDLLLSSGTMYVNAGNLGSGVYDCDLWNICYVSFAFDTNRFSPNVKIRFIIEYQAGPSNTSPL